MQLERVARGNDLTSVRMEPHRTVMEIVDSGRHHFATTLASFADTLARGADVHHNIFSHKKVQKQSSPLQGTSQLVNPLERLTAMSQSVLQRALAMSRNMSIANNIGSRSGPMLASTTSALATLSAAPLMPSVLLHQPAAVSQQQVTVLSNPTKPPPTWVKEPSKAARSLAQEIAEASQVGCAGFIRPVHKSWEISSNFGPRWGRNHNGVDLAAPTGEPILAADSGEVTFAGWEPSGYGYLVEITHKDGWKTLYAHTSEIFTWEGQYVKRGECIASVGETGRATGPHLHWEIRNQNGSPVDPASYIDL